MEEEEGQEMREWSPSMAATMSVIDRGDAPAQLVIEKNLKAQAQRQADQTKDELDRITSRVNKTVAAFELNEEMMDENKAAYFVPDLLELEKIISDTIQKRRYQQQVMIFVVGFEEVTGQRLKLLTQINDFFGTYINTINDEDLKPKQPDVDLEEVSVAVQDALETASNATQKLAEINTEILSYVEKVTGGKAASKSKKKLEKALLQAKEDILSLTDKLQGAQAEIEDKEDQMTRLYKQIDMKSMEVLRHKNAAEQAKKKLDQVSELQREIEERDEEIERLNKVVDESQLSLKQLENSKENSFARLKAANDDGEQTIEKLQHKIQALNVQLGNVWNDSQKQFEETLQKVKEEHREEVEAVREELQARIDDLEEEALNQPKTWASDSEDERELSKSFSRKSSGRDLKSSSSTSRQPSSRRQDPPSRQATDASINSDKGLDPPKPKNIAKIVTEDDSSRTKASTPKRAMRGKSNLEPVHEVPFEGKIPIEDEERWSKVPQEQLPSAFKQYRKEALFIVQGLQTQIKTNQEENHKKVKQLRNHIKDKEEKWDKERHILIQQVEVAREAEKEAEKEADSAVAQLESFVKEHETTTKAAMKQEQKALKTLTPEQRAKYLGEFNPMDMVKPIAEEKKKPVSRLTPKTPQRRPPPRRRAKKPTNQPKRPKAESFHDTSDGEIVEELTFDEEYDEDNIDGAELADQFEKLLASGLDGEDELERPLSASSHHSQQSLYEKFRAQLEQRKLDIVERRSRATSMHGSLLSSAKSDRHRDQAPGSRGSTLAAPLTPQGDYPFPEEVDKQDMATSPVAYSTSSKSSTHSVQSIVDHPVVQDYLKTYEHVTDFKENVMKLVYNKEFGAALEQLAEIQTVHFNRDINVQHQVAAMTDNVEAFLKEIVSVFGTVMTTPEPEAAVSSLMVSRADTGKSRVGLQLPPPPGAIQEGLEREVTELTNQSTEIIRELQENYDLLKQEAGKQQMDYEDKLNNNTVMMMEMQNTIQDLQQELQALEGSKAMSSGSRVSTSTSSRELQVDPTIIFSRSDSERNQKALKRAISTQKVSAEQYNEAVRAMDQYTVLPAKRLVHIVRKFSHHTEMKRIEDNVRQSNSIDDEVFTLLEKMEALQTKRAQRWGEEMDALTSERNRLAHLLMETLSSIEQESGIFMIKPILSWKGRGFAPQYPTKLGSYQPPKRVLRPITPDERKGTPFTIVPAPTPANMGSRVGYRPGTRNSTGSALGGGGDGQRLFTPSGLYNGGAMGASLKGSAVQMVGEAPQPMWSMSTSLPTHGGDGLAGGGGTGGLTGAKLNFMTTPRLLELDVNRLLIGQNTVTAATKALLSNDRLVNAANSSVRSYVTISRPSTHAAVPNLRPSRPNSSGELEKGKTSTSSPLPPSPSSAGPHGRTRSEGALHLSQPLPPIKVPSNEKEENEGADIHSLKGDRDGDPHTSRSNHDSRNELHPSPPHTPPGSSLRHSPAVLDDDTNDEEHVSHRASPGHITKVSLRSASRSSEHNLPE